MFKTMPLFLVVVSLGFQRTQDLYGQQQQLAETPSTQVGAPRVPPNPSPIPTAILWQDPVDIKSRDLYWGSGGQQRAPQPPFTFVQAMDGGTQPKFVVRDGKGLEWRVKIGPEARPETAATRFVWAAGYFTDDDYVLSSVRIIQMPIIRHDDVLPDGTLRFARFERDPYDGEFKGSWNWGKNPFAGSRELNGLKALMGFLNNWDLKDDNTSIYALRDSNTHVYLVGDLGKSFGRAGYVMGKNRPGDIKAFGKSELFDDIDEDDVTFRAPKHAPYLHPMAIPHAFYNLWAARYQRVTNDIPREHVKWIAGVLSQLSERQIRSAFEGAGYSPEEVALFTEIISVRIARLGDL
jgi:hypothetical protein